MKSLPNIPKPLLAALIVVLWLVVSFRFRTPDPYLWGKIVAGDVRVEAFSQEWGDLHVNEDLSGGKLIDGQPFTTGLGTHALSRIEVSVLGSAAKLVGRCAYPDSQYKASIRCRIRDERQIYFESKPLSKDARSEWFMVPVPNDRHLLLEIFSLAENIHNAHGVWTELVATDN